jgi:hypothetical protein
MRGWVLGAAVLALVAGCTGGTSPSVDGPQPSPSPTGAVAQSRLEAMLLQPSDLPGLAQRRVFASAGLTTQSTPQLALCHAPATVGPHELANVIATSPKPGGVKVFEVLSVFADEAAAKAAYAHHVADARACGKYVADGITHRVAGLAGLDLGAGIDAVQYGVVTSDVLSGDVRTYARRGSTTVLITGFGAPPTGQSLLVYQTALMRKALARLG